MSNNKRKAFWAALSRLISVALAAGAGSLLYQVIGHDNLKVSVALLMGLFSFVLLWYVELKKLE